MAYNRDGGRGGYRGGRGGGGYARRSGGGDRRNQSPRSSARLTGLFPTKRENLYVGSTDIESLKALVEVIKKASAANAGVTFFLWENDRDNKARFTIYADVDQTPSGQRSSRRPIEDEGDEPEPEGEYEPFKD